MVPEEMKTFKTAVFGGYQKADVEQYINNLKEEKRVDAEAFSKKLDNKDSELESLGRKLKDKDSALEELSRKLEGKDIALEEFRQNLNKKDSALEELSRKLEGKDSALEELNRKLEERDCLYQERQDQVKEYEQRAAVLCSVLEDARIRADQVVNEAYEKADHVTQQTEEDILQRKRTAEIAFQNEFSQNMQRLMTLKMKMNDYLDYLEEMQKGIGAMHDSIREAAMAIPTDMCNLKMLTEKCAEEAASPESMDEEEALDVVAVDVKENQE